MAFGASELILNSDGSVYHLGLRPDDIADTIITVGDPDRVAQVSQHFDHISLKKQKREFLTHTGTLNQKRITVISTGIGTDNIDIILNELDALVNIDFDTRSPKANTTVLDILRIGTSGALQQDVAVDTFIGSTYAIGLDGLLHFYDCSDLEEAPLSQQLVDHMQWKTPGVYPYSFRGSNELQSRFKHPDMGFGITVTNAGFYGPQGRSLRLTPSLGDFGTKLSAFQYLGARITNLEMETAGIYGLCKLLGHNCFSLNAILANRVTHQFSANPQKTVDTLIALALEKLT
ncbi:MAG: nucleoside phosphorylase [Bacteroidota bacterium]